MVEGQIAQVTHGTADPARSKTQRPRIICRMPLLDTSRLREAHTFEVTTGDWSGPPKQDCRSQAIIVKSPRRT